MSEQVQNRLRVLVVGDRPIVHEAVSAAIDDQDDMATVGQETGRRQPDVVIMDLFLPEQESSEAIAQIRQQWPRVCALVLTSSTDERLIGVCFHP